VFLGAWLKYSPRASGSSAGAPPAALPQVVVSKPLAQDIDTRLGFLGQFAAVSQVELRAQVGGTLTGIFFKDGTLFGRATSFSPLIPAPTRLRSPRPLPNSTLHRLDWNWLTDNLAVPRIWSKATLEAWKTWTSAHPINEQAALRLKTRKPNPRCTVRPRPLPDYGAVHRAHGHTPRFDRQFDRWQPHSDESDNAARDARVA